MAAASRTAENKENLREKKVKEEEAMICFLSEACLMCSS